MRVIKFRAWDKDKKLMVFPNRFVLVSGVIDSVHIDTDAGVNDEGILFKKMERVKNFEIMQFTDLQDKNGKEIYEGDIIKEVKKDFYKKEYDGDNYIIKFGKYDDSEMEWGSPAIGFYGENINNGHQDSPINLEEVEVIGNIYENGGVVKLWIY